MELVVEALAARVEPLDRSHLHDPGAFDQQTCERKRGVGQPQAVLQGAFMYLCQIMESSDLNRDGVQRSQLIAEVRPCRHRASPSTIAGAPR